MKSFNTLFIVFFIFFALLITSDVNSQESAVTSPKVAVVNFQKLVIESNIGKKYLKSARANVENKQKILSKLEDQVRSMRDKYDEQKLVLDEKARDEKGEDLAYKITELRRKREDFEADIKIQDSKFQRDIMRVAMKSVKVVSEQLGYDFVISAQAPGLMYLNPSLDIRGILLTMYDKRNKLSGEVEIEARNYFKDKVYSTAVPRNVRLSEAPSHGVPVLIYDKACPGSRAYFSFTEEFLDQDKPVESAA